MTMCALSSHRLSHCAYDCGPFSCLLHTSSHYNTTMSLSGGSNRLDHHSSVAEHTGWCEERKQSSTVIFRMAQPGWPASRQLRAASSFNRHACEGNQARESKAGSGGHNQKVLHCMTHPFPLLKLPGSCAQPLCIASAPALSPTK